ncbi:sodium ion-translocating decarboxylase subunit beta [Enterococcus devriesei]|uniref:Sodium ion-translocating decarboxylase, beta subunit n=1 Tax=Enterococcus devriesei TaxID=319970 RepID=A0A1L8SXE1_9ENTE|nr:sodium ion-translocating decarboxylase subunit beta [Enterococcus devriesei]MBU5365364.1 sodium ion-translocating decarboxylase subunit beta [Enterococcus devriesei]MDT2822460.1 sodium ion-translocating decarboxylase subunit beta [Enterococcus devriesei]OJG36562.1 sodium ion-translocating decarboxylase, beta subunit [Enterococcus devriesei]
MSEIVQQLIDTSGFANLTFNNLFMIVLACFFLYLGIKKQYEPYLMIPISFGILLVNLPLANLMASGSDGTPGGLLYYLYQGTNLGIYPPLIFLCLGASTDFGPLLANPKTILLGGAAQFGIFAAFFLAVVLGMTPNEAASIGIIGGADGPTSIFLTTRLAPHLLSAIALAAYSYMALVPIIQPPIIRLLTTKKERQVQMKEARKVSQKEKIVFPIIVTIFVSLLVPSATTLIGMLMLGNLIRECKLVPKLTDALQNSLMYIVTILLGVTVGAKADGDIFLSVTTLKIIFLGLLAFCVGTAAGVLLGKVMYRLSGGKINPMIGAAGVSAVPMAARVVQNEGQKENPHNYLLMHAMGPNVAGVIGSAVAAGVLLAFFGR